MDPSRILNVPADADKETISKAYRKMALKYHPDRAGDHSKLKFQHVGAAYEILMAKPGGKETESHTGRYAGMSDEDVAWINLVRSQQLKEYSSFNFAGEHEKEDTESKFSSKREENPGSSKFSSESDSSSTKEAAGFLKDCPICNGPCNVEEFVAPPPSDLLDLTS
jgi:DnaJ-class molecular chaperone